LAGDFTFHTIDPRNPTGRKVRVILPGELIDRYYKYTYVAYENFRAAKHVLENPQRIFTGIREFNEGEWWCYTGRPERWHVAEAVTAPFPKNRVFAVYLNSRMIVYECRSEPAAEDDSMCPLDWQNRYGGLVWKSTS